MGILSFFRSGEQALTEKETALVTDLGFNPELMKALKQETKSELMQLPEIDAETGDVLEGHFNGIHSGIAEKKANTVVKKLKEKFRTAGYLMFVFTGEDDAQSIAVLKGEKELDILRYRKTDGCNYDLENEDILAKVAEWDRQYGLVILGCGRDWLELEFKKLPDDLNAFAEEVYAFCPDSVDQGVGEVELLKEAIEETCGVWLWWD